jgi:hypothetical protein
MAVSVKVRVLWDVAPCSLIEVHVLHTSESCHLHAVSVVRWLRNISYTL